MRTRLLEHLKSQDILAVFHYVPLHTAKAGSAYGRFYGLDRFTTSESERLIRLPMWYGIDIEVQRRVVNAIFDFYS